MSVVNIYMERLRRMFDEQLRNRYEELPVREQKLVLLLMLFLMLTLPLFGLVVPVSKQLQQTRQSVQALNAQAVEAELLANSLAQGGGAPATGNMMSSVDRLARSSGVREFMTRIRPKSGPGGDRALTVQIKSAPYSKVVSFLISLAGNGLGLSQMKMQAAEKPGHVHLTAEIVGG